MTRPGRGALRVREPAPFQPSPQPDYGGRAASHQCPLSDCRPAAGAPPIPCGARWGLSLASTTSVTATVRSDPVRHGRQPLTTGSMARQEHTSDPGDEYVHRVRFGSALGLGGPTPFSAFPQALERTPRTRRSALDGSARHYLDRATGAGSVGGRSRQMRLARCETELVGNEVSLQCSVPGPVPRDTTSTARWRLCQPQPGGESPHALRRAVPPRSPLRGAG